MPQKSSLTFVASIAKLNKDLKSAFRGVQDWTQFINPFWHESIKPAAHQVSSSLGMSSSSKSWSGQYLGPGERQT